METRITIKNYRCFSGDHPASFTLGEGFTGFVGMNNSGKSTLLRFFYEFRPLFTSAAQNPSQVFIHQPLSVPREVADHTELFTDTNAEDLEIILEPSGLAPRSTFRVFDRLTIRITRPNGKALRWSATLGDGQNEYPSANVIVNSDGHMQIHGGPGVVSFAEISELLGLLSSSLYLPPFRNAVSQSTGSYYDVAVGTAFVQNWRLMKTGPTKSSNEAIVRLTDDIRRIFEFQTLEINPSNDDATLKLMIDGRSYRLDDLGSGIAEFILTLGAAAIRRPALILLDEPELHLHPSLQLDFLTTLASYATYGVLFSTHNVGLGRAIANRLYAFKRTAGGLGQMSRFSAGANLAEFLGEMSFAGYRALGYENVLLVEGETDVSTVQQFLRIYRKDHKVIPLPLRGSTTIAGSDNARRNLTGVLDISRNITALIDSERTAAGAPLEQSRADFERICGEMGIKCKVMDRRAIENYLSDAAVKKVHGPSAKALGPFEGRSGNPSLWPKEVNWRIAREMTEDELNATDLGTFFQTL